MVQLRRARRLLASAGARRHSTPSLREVAKRIAESAFVYPSVVAVVVALDVRTNGGRKSRDFLQLLPLLLQLLLLPRLLLLHLRAAWRGARHGGMR